MSPERPRVGTRGSFHFDLRTGEIKCTEGISRAFGRAPGWAPANPDEYFAALHPDERATYRARLASMLAPPSEGESGEAPAGSPSRQRVVWPDGTVVELMCESAVQSDGAGQAVAIVGSKRLVRVMHDAGRAPAALRRAAADIAHDLRNLTQALHSNVELMTVGEPLDEVGQKALVDISQRMEELARELGSLEGRRRSSARWTELRRWLSSVEVLLRDALGPHRRLELSLPPLALFGLIPARRVEQALLHLVTNSREATPRGGEVRVSLAPRSGGRAFALTVSDDGQGMDDDAVRSSIERGVSSRGPGRGLGLAIVRELVDQLHGELHIDSIPGEGTRVELVIPAGEEP